MTTDRKTTIAGALSGILLAVKPLIPAEYGAVYDNASAMIAGLALMLLGYWTNK
jgi:hypothetical protein